MLKTEHVEVSGWEAALRGMRNPLDSWHMSDTEYDGKVPIIGPADLKLMRSLTKFGTPDRKFLRMLTVTMDITAPLYWWKEFDTYKVGTVANSCSTMHTIKKSNLSADAFSFDGATEMNLTDRCTINRYIELLNKLQKNCTVGDPAWRALIQLLPCSFNQRRTVQLNYEVAMNIVATRSNHKLSEWHTLCDALRSLPYFKEVCLYA